MNIQVKPVIDFLGLDGLVTTKVDETSFDDEIFAYAEPSSGLGSCPRCGSLDVHRHGGQEGRFKDATARGKKVTIVIAGRRRICTHCSKTWTQAIPSLHEDRMMTRRLEKDISRRCFTTHNMNVAREYGLDEGTIRNVFKDHVAEIAKGVVYETPRILGIDEIHLSEVRCVLTNVAKQSLFDILPSRTKPDLAAYFKALPDKKNVEVIVADMWKAYHALAAEFFPGRLVVVDRFHFQRMAQNGFDEVRMACGRERSQETRIRLKDERFLLWKRRSRLTDKERDRANMWLNTFPKLRTAYNVKERLMDAYEAPSRNAAERAIAKLIQAIPPELDRHFREMTTAYGNWKEPILNYFVEPVTNGYTEAQNSLIREWDQLGRGYSYEVLRARMLYDRTARKKRTSTRSRRPEIPDDACGLIGFDFGNPFADDDDEIVEYGPAIPILLDMLRTEFKAADPSTET